jgi:hypothetical protein
MASDGSTFLGLDTTGWTAATATATGLLVVAGVITAVVALRQLRQTGAIRRQEARAYVIADFEPSDSSGALVDFVVRNVGRTAAFDIQLKWDQAPQAAVPVPAYPLADVRMFREPIAMLAPGRELRTFFESHPERRSRPDLPASYRVTVSYRTDATVGAELHSDTFPLDLNAEEGKTYIRRYDVSDIAPTLEAIRDDLRKSGLLQRPLDIRTETRRENERREAARYIQIARRRGAVKHRPNQKPKRR